MEYGSATTSVYVYANSVNGDSGQNSTREILVPVADVSISEEDIFDLRLVCHISAKLRAKMIECHVRFHVSRT